MDVLSYLVNQNNIIRVTSLPVEASSPYLWSLKLQKMENEKGLEDGERNKNKESNKDVEERALRS